MILEHLADSLRQSPGVMETRLAGAARAAVAVICRPDGGVLFIRRAVHEQDPWSGHIALPGGRVDPEDENDRAAAVRESLEEVGVDLSGSICLGMLDQVASPDLAPRVLVSPFVFVLDHDPATRLDASEVAEVLWFGLDRLHGGEGRGTFPYEYKGNQFVLPRIDLDGARIWGMTLRIVDDLVGRLQPKS